MLWLCVQVFYFEMENGSRPRSCIFLDMVTETELLTDDESKCRQKTTHLPTSSSQSNSVMSSLCQKNRRVQSHHVAEITFVFLEVGENSPLGSPLPRSAKCSDPDRTGPSHEHHPITGSSPFSAVTPKISQQMCRIRQKTVITTNRCYHQLSGCYNSHFLGLKRLTDSKM